MTGWNRRRHSPLVVAALSLGIALTPWLASFALATEPEQPAKLDCAVDALFLLLRIEGCPAKLERIEAALPRRHPEGYSMAELADAAQSVGLRLEGVRFGKGDRALDRPAIAFVKYPRGGHFIVLRPVGTTGTMVQVIDPPHVPVIVDYDNLFASRVWTGRILLPRKTWPARQAVPLIVAGLGLPIVSLSVWRFRRARRLRAQMDTSQPPTSTDALA